MRNRQNENYKKKKLENYASFKNMYIEAFNKELNYNLPGHSHREMFCLRLGYSFYCTNPQTVKDGLEKYCKKLANADDPIQFQKSLAVGYG
jgi:hypothetical protein